MLELSAILDATRFPQEKTDKHDLRDFEERWKKTYSLFAKYEFSFEQRTETVDAMVDQPDLTWVSWLERAMAFSGECPSIAPLTSEDFTRHSMAPHRPAVYLETVWPFWSVAQQEISLIFASYPELKPQTWHNDLLMSLAWPVGRVFAALTQKKGENRETVLEKFRQRESYWPLISSYPILLRLLSIITRNTAQNAQIFKNRLDQDWPMLQAKGWIKEGSQLVDVQSGSSDPHIHGQSNIRLIFSQGEKIIYKPRPMDMEVAYEGLIAWVNERCDEPPFMSCPSIHQGEYGWMLFLDKQPLSSDAIYAERLGNIQALFYFLCGCDMHVNNYVVHQDYPVAIDLECLFSPTSDDPSKEGEIPPSIFSGLAPSWQASRDRKYINYHWGIASSKKQSISKYPKFVEKDGIVKVEWLSYISESKKTNLPNGTSPLENLPSFLKGFLNVYEFVVQHQEALLEAGGPIDAFAGKTCRTVLRGTQDYRDALFLAIAPDCLKSGEAYFVGSERCFMHFPLWAEDESPCQASVHYEKRAIMRLDIPIFHGKSDSRHLFTGDGEDLGLVVNEAPMDSVKKRITEANEADAQWQAQCHQALYRSIAVNERIVPFYEASTETRANVKNIANAIEQLKINSSQGPRWFDWIPNDANDTSLNLSVASPALYEGNDGNALFLWHAGTLLQEQRYKDLAVQSLEAGFQLSPGLSFLPCAYSGAGFSSLYTHLHIGQRADDGGRLLERAEQLLQAIFNWPDEIWLKGRHDWIGGLSSAIAVLTLASKTLHSPQALELAKTFGVQLLSICHEETPKKLGMAHGLAGWAHALWKLHTSLEQAGQQSSFGEDALNFWSAQEDQWRAWAEGNMPKNALWWCAGLPGMGLSRLAEGAPEFVRAQGKEMLQMAIQGVPDHLQNACCGESGRILSWMQGGKEFYETAQARAAAMNQHFSEGKPWQYQLFWSGNIIPGLMSGTAGIGLSLLSADFPGQVPNLLCLD